MFLGIALMIGGALWLLDVRRRPQHQSSDYKGPAIMIAVGVALLVGYLLWVGSW